MEDRAGLVNSKGEKGGNMYERAEGLSQRSHLSKFSVAVLILFTFLIVVGNGSCLANGFNPFKLVHPSFAISVVGVSHSDPSRAVGPPDVKYVSLGRTAGYIVATMGAPFTNGPGADIRVYEVGNLQGGGDEEFDVFISANSSTWIQVADNVKNDSGGIFASIDISPYSGEYRYIKIVNRSSSGGSTPGADIDAIEILHPRSSSSLILRILVLLIVVVAIVAIIQ